MTHLNTIRKGDSIHLMGEMEAGIADLIFADVPYNMQLEGDLLRPDGSMVDAVDDAWDQFNSFDSYDKFTREWLEAARRVIKPNGSLWVMGSHTNMYRIGTILQDQGWWILNDVSWIKVNPTPNMKGTRFCNAIEHLIWAVPSKKAKYTFNYQLMKAANEDKQMRSDWYFNICQGKERIMGDDGKKAHSTQKPESLLRRVILATSNPEDIILDPFVGSGTSAAVAKKLGRHYIGIDLAEKNVQISSERLDKIIFGEGLSTVEGSLIGGKKPKLAFVLLVEHGYLKANDVLRIEKSGSTYVASINEDGTITHHSIEKDNGSLEEPAKLLRGSIHQVGKIVLGLPSCNGWTTWEYFDSQARLWTSLDALRTFVVAELAKNCDGP